MRTGQGEDFHVRNLDFLKWDDAAHNNLHNVATLDRIMHFLMADFVSAQNRPSAPLKGSTRLVQCTLCTAKLEFKIFPFR